MRTPGLRLRQVFEHGTHFKVQKPGGQTITIAKKGLSPSTVGRLRRFAQGGEVQGYDNGGEVVDPSQAAFEAEQARMTEAQRAIDAAVQNTAATAPEGVAPAPPSAEPTPRRRVVSVAANEAAQTPAPAQPTIIINNTPTPTAQPQPAPQAMTVAPAAEEAEKETPVAEKAPVAAKKAAPVAIEEVPLAPSGVAPEASTSPVFMKAPAPALAVPVKPPVGSFLSKPGLLVPPLASPSLSDMAPAAPEAVPATQATTSAPTALVVTPTPVPAPAAAFVARPLTGASLVEAAKTQPNATVTQLVESIAGPEAAMAVNIHAPDVAAVPAASLVSEGKVPELLASALSTSVNAAVEKGKADAAAAQLELEDLKRQELAAAEKARKDEERRQGLVKRKDELTAYAEANDDIKSFFASQGTAKSVLGIIGLAIGGFLSGYTGTPNYALSAFNKAMENDLEEQKRRRNSRWAKIKDLTQDADAASDIVNGDNAILASIALKKTAARQGLGRIQPQVEATIAELTRRASLDYAAAEFKIAAAEDKREVVAPRPVVVRPVAPKGAGTAQENLEERKKTNERERLVSVDGIPVRRATKQRQAMTQSGIDRRISYIEGVAKLEKAIKDHGNNIYNVLATDRGDIIADLALSLENSPQGFGYERAISRNAAVVLEEGMGNPASLKAALLKVFGRDPAAGVRRLREDTQGQLNQLLKGLADPSSQRDKDASEYGRWKIGNRIKLILGEKEIAAPKLGTPIDQITALPPDSPLYVPSAAAASETPAAAPAAPADDWRAKLRVVGKL